MEAQLLQARSTTPPAQFQRQLRQIMLDRPDLTLRSVADSLGLTRQRVSAMVGPLGRPNCATNPNRSSPVRDQTQKHLKELTKRVAKGQPAAQAAAALGISPNAAWKMGFRARTIRPSHGTAARAELKCNCWRCRRAIGVTRSYHKTSSAQQIARQVQILDWLAWTDPDDGSHLTQEQIGRLVGTRQCVVSRVKRATEEAA